MSIQTARLRLTYLRTRKAVSFRTFRISAKFKHTESKTSTMSILWSYSDNAATHASSELHHAAPRNEWPTRQIPADNGKLYPKFVSFYVSINQNQSNVLQHYRCFWTNSVINNFTPLISPWEKRSTRAAFSKRTNRNGSGQK